MEEGEGASDSHNRGKQADKKSAALAAAAALQRWVHGHREGASVEFCCKTQ